MKKNSLCILAFIFLLVLPSEVNAKAKPSLACRNPVHAAIRGLPTDMQYTHVEFISDEVARLVGWNDELKWPNYVQEWNIDLKRRIANRVATSHQSPLSKPCQNCTINVIDTSKDGKWQVAHVFSPNQNMQGIWLLGQKKRYRLELLDDVLTFRWQWSTDNKYLWLVHSLPYGDATSYKVVWLTERPQTVRPSQAISGATDWLKEPSANMVVFNPAKNHLYLFDPATAQSPMGDTKLYTFAVTNEVATLVSRDSANGLTRTSWDESANTLWLMTSITGTRTIMDLNKTTQIKLELNGIQYNDLDSPLIRQIGQEIALSPNNKFLIMLNFRGLDLLMCVSQ